MDNMFEGTTFYRCEAKYFSNRPVEGITEFGAMIGATLGFLLGLVGLWFSRNMGPMISYPFALAVVSSGVSAAFHWTYHPRWHYLDEITNALVTAAAAITFTNELFFRLRRKSTGGMIPILSAFATLVLCGYIIAMLDRASTDSGGQASSALSHLSSILVSLSMVAGWAMRNEHKPPPGSRGLIIRVFIASVMSSVLWSIEIYACPHVPSVAYLYPGALWELSKAYEIYCMLILSMTIRMFNYGFTVWYCGIPSARFALIPFVRWGTLAEAELASIVGEFPAISPAAVSKLTTTSTEIVSNPLFTQIAKPNIWDDGTHHEKT